jgi:uncharacterized protein (DUF1330 family)
MIYPKGVVVVAFDTLEQAKLWYASPEYQATIPARQRSANASLILVDGVAPAAPSR